jgi:hypothetical protein
VAPICFLHIPKTSGTSVAIYIQSQVDTAAVCPARYGDDYTALGAAKLTAFEFFRAECDASVLDLLPPASAVVTLLRAPLARALSHWRYIQRLPEHRLHEQFQRGHGSFEQFAAAMPANPMARLLAASGAAPRSMWEPIDVWPDDELLDRAVARLEQCAVVGLAEHHDESLALVADHFGWAPPARLPRTNAAPLEDGRAHATPAAAAMFADRNPVDLELYRIARTMFDRRRNLASASSRMARFRRRVAADAQMLTQRHVIDMCRPVRGSGWLPVVETERGRIRPIGAGGRASLAVPVTLGRFTKLEVVCPVMSSDEALATLEISVNGEVVAFERLEQPFGVTIRAPLPPTALADGFTQIEFRTGGGVAVPHGHTGAESDLEATLGISRVELIPYDPASLRATRRDAGAKAPTTVRAARLFWRTSPTWAFDEDLEHRIDRLDLWNRVEELQRDGYTVIPEVVPPATVRRARELIDRYAVGSPHRTRRRDVHQPFLFDPLFTDLLLHPVQLALADAVCGKGLLDSQTGLVRDRNSNPQGLHAENALWLPAPYPDHHYVCSAMLTCDDFDVANGGTCFVPGSHRTRVDPSPDESLDLTGAVTPSAPAGSLIVWLGGTWHGANQRMTDGERISLLTIFTRPSLRPAQDIRAIPDPFVDTDELRLRLRRSDPFERDGEPDHDPDAMLHWIRNQPLTGDQPITCGWDQTVADTRKGRIPR